MATKIAVMGAGGYIGQNLQHAASGAHDAKVVVLGRDDIAAACASDSTALGLDASDTTAPTQPPPRQHNRANTDNKNSAPAIDTIRGSAALINLAGSGRQSAASPFSDSVAATAAAAALLCRHAGIPRIVHISGLGASARSPIAYLAAKYAAETTIRGSGLDYVIFRPSYVVGRGDHLTSYILSHARRDGSPPTPADIYECYANIQPIHVDDAADAIIWGALKARPPIRTTIDLVGPDRIPFYNYMSLIARACRVPPNPLTMQRAYEHALRSPEDAAFGVDDLGIITGGFTSNPHNLVRATGIVPRSVVSALESGRLP